MKKIFLHGKDNAGEITMTDGAENYSKEARDFSVQVKRGLVSMMNATKDFNSKVDFASDLQSETTRQMIDISETIVSLGQKIIAFDKLLLQQEEGA